MIFVCILFGGLAVVAGMFFVIPVVLPPESVTINFKQSLELAGSAIGFFFVGWFFGASVQGVRTIKVRRREASLQRPAVRDVAAMSRYTPSLS